MDEKKEELKIVYGTNPETGWGLLATMNSEGKVVHQLLMICPGFASDQEFVVKMQEIAFEKMEKDWVSKVDRVEEVKRDS